MSSRGTGFKKPWRFRSDNVVDEIYDAQEMRQEIKTFFRRSPLWKALVKTIVSACDRKALISPPEDWVEEPGDLRVACHRGTGHGICIDDVAIYGPRNAASSVELKLEVDWESPYEEFSRKYTLAVPIELCKDFSQDAYDAWVTSRKQGQAIRDAHKDLEALAAMQTKYGSSASIRATMSRIKDFINSPASYSSQDAHCDEFSEGLL